MHSKTFHLADRYVDRVIALHPVAAVTDGLTDTVEDLTDLSPAGWAARAKLSRESLSALTDLVPIDSSDALAHDYMSTRLRAAVALDEAGQLLEPLRADWGAAQQTRQLFDLIPRDTSEDWAHLAALLGRVPWALAGLRDTFEQGIRTGAVGSRRQVLGCAVDAERWSAQGDDGFFGELVREAPVDLTDAARTAARGYGELARFLRDVSAPAASDVDACGRDAYERCANDQLGGDVDLDETYEWGWTELHRLLDERQRVCDQVEPGVTFEQAIKALIDRPDGWIVGRDNYHQWLQDVQDRAGEELHGNHFDILEGSRRVEVVIASAGSAPWYTPPSEDCSTPGRVDWPIAAHRNSFRPLQSLTTAYHEGIPGHHLQNVAVRAKTDTLSRYQRLFPLGFHGEGWAHYAEGLMSELGYMDDPEAALGYLTGQIIRAVRVILDIGLHLELAIPADEKFHPGQLWNHDLAVEFLSRQMSETRAAREVYRYLGMPGQAITYALGRRAWEDARTAVEFDLGARFDLKTFHSEALAIGPLGVNSLEREIRAACANAQRRSASQNTKVSTE